jgi:hypothetical protein
MDATNKSLVMSSILLLSKSEQAEIFQAVRDLQDQQVVEAVTMIADGAPGQPVDKRVAKYVKLRDARAANTKLYEVVDKAYKECLAAIESSLLADANTQGVKGFKTAAGTVYTEERTQASIADESIFFDFVRTSGDLDFFERRLKVGHLKEYADAHEGQMPPGLNIFREIAVKVRRA